MDVHASEGELTIDFAPEGIFGAAELEFPGDGLLRVDPARPSRLLSIRVRNPLLASATLGAVLGQRLWSAVEQSLRRGQDPPEKLPGPEPSTEATDLFRLSFSTWYASHTPVSIPEEFTNLDVASAAQNAGRSLAAFNAFDHAKPALEAVSNELDDRAGISPALENAWEGIRSTAIESLGPNHSVADSLIHHTSGAIQQSRQTEVSHQSAQASAPSVFHLQTMPVLGAAAAGVSGSLGSYRKAGIRSLLSPDEDQIPLPPGPGEARVDPRISVEWSNSATRFCEETDNPTKIDHSSERLRVVLNPRANIVRPKEAARRLALRAVATPSGDSLGWVPFEWDKKSERFVAEMDDLATADFPSDYRLQVCALTTRQAMPDEADALAETAQRSAIRSLAYARMAKAAASAEQDETDWESLAVDWANRSASIFDEAVELDSRFANHREAARQWAQLLETEGALHSDPGSLDEPSGPSTTNALADDYEVAPLFSELAYASGLARSFDVFDD
jgi:hypothetical protein